MNRIQSALQQHEKIRYIIIGIIGYIIELLVIFLAQRIGATGTVAVGLSFIVGLAVSFMLQKIITFQDRSFHRKIVTRQVLLYALLVLFNFCFTIFVTAIFEPYSSVSVIRTVALAVTVIWNYYLYRTVIFHHKNT